MKKKYEKYGQMQLPKYHSLLSHTFCRKNMEKPSIKIRCGKIWKHMENLKQTANWESFSEI